MVDIKECPICGSKHLQHHSSVKDHSVSQEEFNLTQCDNCGFLFTNPQPSPKELWKYYESEDYVSHSKTTKGFINYWYRQFQSLNLRLKYTAIKPHVPRGTWLDYGAGGGDFVRFIGDKNIEILGLEPSDTARASAKKDGIALYNTDYISSIRDDSIACITMWHVLEHISNFTEVLSTLHSKLLPEGLLVIAVPNHESADSQHYENDWAALDVPRHLWHFSEKNIQDLADMLNMKMIKVKGMPFDSTYVSLLSEKYRSGSKVSALFQGLTSNLKASLKKAPYSSQIYILRK